MKIAVLGANGFVGSNIAKHLVQKHDVTKVTRKTLDLLDPIAVREFLKDNSFDVIVNCAAVMTNDETLHDARNNLGMFMNFYNNSDLFGKFINTGSGAEFDRNTNIDEAVEARVFTRMPADSYGWGQNVKSRLCAEKPRFYTIRIFNCFGKGEPATRIFPRMLSQDNLEISNDRYFDYFSIQDLGIVVEHCIDHDWPIDDVNAVYMEKYKISEVIEKFCTLNQLQPNFKVVSTNFNNYTGSGISLKTLGIKLNGLEHGLLSYTQEGSL
jgi:nucleoside-diphosphate-sugar epimerase